MGRSQVFSNNQSMDLMVSEDRPYADAVKVYVYIYAASGYFLWCFFLGEALCV